MSVAEGKSNARVVTDGVGAVYIMTLLVDSGRPVLFVTEKGVIYLMGLYRLFDVFFIYFFTAMEKDQEQQKE